MYELVGISHAAQTSVAVREKVAVAAGRDAGDFLEVFRAMLPENVIAAATDNGQMLGVIVFSILFAIAITRIPAAKCGRSVSFSKRPMTR